MAGMSGFCLLRLNLREICERLILELEISINCMVLKVGNGVD
jgi:hypothetical protein